MSRFENQFEGAKGILGKWGWIKISTFGFLGLFIIVALLSSFYSVDQRERAVVLRNGAIIGEAEPGLHFKVPFVDSAVKISTQSHRAVFDKMEAYSRDQQPASLRLSVLYSIPQARVTEVYSRFSSQAGIEDRIVAPKVYEQAKNVFGQFDAVTAVQDRVKLNAEIAKAVHEAIGAMHAPINVEAVQIENIEFSPEYMRSIEQRMQAAVEVDRLKQNALREEVQAKIAVTQANGAADALRAQAQADRDATRYRAEGEASAIRARGEAEAAAIQARAAALGSNPGLVALVQAEKWDGKLPGVMPPNSAVPMLNLTK